MSDATGQEQNGFPEGFDREEPKAGYLFFFTAAIILAVIGMVAFVVFYYRKAEDAQQVIKVQIPIDQDALQLHEKENWELNEYSYINRSAGVVRLPIKRAMQLLVEEDAAGKYPFPTGPYPSKPLEPDPPVPGVTSPAAANQ
jgi:hypothetical protein